MSRDALARYKSASWLCVSFTHSVGCYDPLSTFDSTCHVHRSYLPTHTQAACHILNRRCGFVGMTRQLRYAIVEAEWVERLWEGEHANRRYQPFFFAGDTGKLRAHWKRMPERDKKELTRIDRGSLQSELMEVIVQVCWSVRVSRWRKCRAHLSLRNFGRKERSIGCGRS
eukprot:3795594-Rhodomonas_salina.6